jgi:hypothetical protein
LRRQTPLAIAATNLGKISIIEHCEIDEFAEISPDRAISLNLHRDWHGENPPPLTPFTATATSYTDVGYFSILA